MGNKIFGEKLQWDMGYLEIDILFQITIIGIQEIWAKN